MNHDPDFSYYTLDSDPGVYGLRVVADVDTGGSYEFDITRVWADADGRLVYYHTAGCSCPSPFDEMSSLSDLIDVPPNPRDMEYSGEMTAAQQLDFFGAVTRAQAFPERVKFRADVYEQEKAVREQEEKVRRARQAMQQELVQCRNELGLTYTQTGDLDVIRDLVADHCLELNVSQTLVLGVYLASKADSHITALREAAEATPPAALGS